MYCYTKILIVPELLTKLLIWADCFVACLVFFNNICPDNFSRVISPVCLSIIRTHSFSPGSFKFPLKKISKYYSKDSIKRPVLLGDLVLIFPKSLYQTGRSISEKIDCTVSFQGCHRQFLGSIK